MFLMQKKNCEVGGGNIWTLCPPFSGQFTVRYGIIINIAIVGNVIVAVSQISQWKYKLKNEIAHTKERKGALDL